MKDGYNELTKITQTAYDRYISVVSKKLNIQKQKAYTNKLIKQVYSKTVLYRTATFLIKTEKNHHIFNAKSYLKSDFSDFYKRLLKIF